LPLANGAEAMERFLNEVGKQIAPHYEDNTQPIAIPIDDRQL
jgi:hypothetical protein